MNKNDIIKANWEKPLSEIAKLARLSVDAARKRGRLMNLPPHRVTVQNKRISPEAEVERDILLGHATSKRRDSEKKNKVLTRIVEDLRGQIRLVKVAQDITTHVIRPKDSTSGSATAVVLASDWHSEERVRFDSVNGKNQFNLEIAKERIETFFGNVVKLINLKQKAIRLDTLVFACLGDFITGNIHQEIETLLEPEEAIVWAEEMLASGIEYILANTNVNIRIPCHSGNHGRSTKTIHQGTEHGNSKEYLMYHFMARFFQKEKRVQFLVSKGYHSFLDINGFVIRFHHGHFISYSGGVGGIYISVNKAIGQWNKVQPVNLDCFGHFHQLRYGGNFVCNGSLIGYNAYAVSIKCDYERPKQTFFLVNHGRKEITDFSPIWVD